MISQKVLMLVKGRVENFLSSISLSDIFLSNKFFFSEKEYTVCKTIQEPGVKVFKSLSVHLFLFSDN